MRKGSFVLGGIGIYWQGVIAFLDARVHFASSEFDYTLAALRACRALTMV